MAFHVNDLVITHTGQAAVVTAIHDYAQHDLPTLYDLTGVVGPLIPHTANEMHPVPHRPAPGQVWRCTDDPSITVTVVSTSMHGLYAECVVPSGTVGTLVLVARYELVGEVPQ